MAYKYQIVGILGEGHFGTVYRVMQSDIAVKVIFLKSGHNENEVREEISIHSTLNHDNIVKCFGYDILTSSRNDIIEINRMTNFLAVAICMEFCDHSLAHELETRYRLVYEEVEAIFGQILNGVSYLHSSQIIHRDLRPKNILVKVQNGVSVIKISDFGLSKFIFTIRPEKYHEIKGVLYSAPEQQDSKVMYNHKVDIFSLGVILAELLTTEPGVDWIPDFRVSYFQKLPPLEKGYKDLVLWMTNVDHTKRPECLQIFNYLSSLKTNIQSMSL